MRGRRSRRSCSAIYLRHQQPTGERRDDGAGTRARPASAPRLRLGLAHGVWRERPVLRARAGCRLCADSLRRATGRVLSSPRDWRDIRQAKGPDGTGRANSCRLGSAAVDLVRFTLTNRSSSDGVMRSRRWPTPPVVRAVRYSGNQNLHSWRASEIPMRRAEALRDDGHGRDVLLMVALLSNGYQLSGRADRRSRSQRYAADLAHPLCRSQADL